MRVIAGSCWLEVVGECCCESCTLCSTERSGRCVCPRLNATSWPEDEGLWPALEISGSCCTEPSGKCCCDRKGVCNTERAVSCVRERAKSCTIDKPTSC